MAINPSRQRLQLAGLVALGALSPALVVRAADSERLRRLGVLSFAGPDEAGTAEGRAQFVRTLAGFGWVEGRNLAIESRYAEYDQARFTPLAVELVRLNMDAIVTLGTPATRSLQGVTKTIPIVTMVGDPVGSGFAQSLARPGGNITGLSIASRENAGKKIETLREITPSVRRLVIMRWQRSGDFSEFSRIYETLGRASGLSVETRVLTTLGEAEVLMTQLRGPLINAVYVAPEFPSYAAKKIAELALRHRVVTVTENPGFVRAGCLLSTRFYEPDIGARQAAILDKIFRGAHPSEIPFELPSRSELIINRRTAVALGVALPAPLLLRADKVID